MCNRCAELERVVARLKAKICTLTPYDASEIVRYATLMQGRKDVAKGSGIHPVLWTIGFKGVASDKQINYALSVMNRKVEKYRTLELQMSDDTETLRLLDERM